jgi:hypothetical protein
MPATEKALLIVGLLCLPLASALAGLYTLLMRNYMIGGRRFGRPEKVYIYPSNRPRLFIFLVGIHVTATCVFCLLIFAVLHNT